MTSSIHVETPSDPGEVLDMAEDGFRALRDASNEPAVKELAAAYLDACRRAKDYEYY